MRVERGKRKYWLLYGANGYTGSRIAERAVALGFKPVLGGRSAEKLKTLAGRLGLEFRIIDLSDSSRLMTQMSEFSVLLNAAGPFVNTYKALVRACLGAGTNYLDITGEIPVFEGLASLDLEGRDSNIMIMPGVGFDMVPGDCLALRLKRLLPDATHLDIGLSFGGTLSRGTILSALLIEPGTLVRREHEMKRLDRPLVRQFDFGTGQCGGVGIAMSMTFGDISVAWRTTGIPNITSYQRAVTGFPDFGKISVPADVMRLPEGPSDYELGSFPTVFVGEVRNPFGQSKAIRLVTPQIYSLTFELAATIAERVHAGFLRRGFQTPAGLFGEDFILSFSGCHWQILDFQ